MSEPVISSTLPEPATLHGANSLLPLVYRELRAAAAKLMADERVDHTLQPTALVHEAYAKLAKADARFRNESHFFYAGAQAMRQVLVDHALARRRQKRGGAGRIKLELDEAILPPQQDVEMDWLALNEALDKLAEASPRRAHVVLLRFFAGLSDARIATMLQISEPTVRRDWAAARMWLYREMLA
jgi:RNA polymerase sigma factor (TIGR02999 family)